MRTTVAACCCTVTVVDPLAPPDAVAVIVATPVPTAVTSPVSSSTEATDGFPEDQVIGTFSTGLPTASRVSAASWTVPSIAVSAGSAGVTETVPPRMPRAHAVQRSRAIWTNPTDQTSPAAVPHTSTSRMPICEA